MAGGYTGRVAPYKGKLAFHLNDQPVAPMMYEHTGVAARAITEELPQRTLHEFTDAGYKLFGTEAWIPELWKADGTISAEPLIRSIREILKINPDAAIMVRLFILQPEWWLDAHPEEQVRFSLYPDNGFPEAVRQNPDEIKRVSFASDLWRESMNQVIPELLRQLAESPEGDAIFSFLVVGGEWAEWFYDKFDLEPDVGPAMTRHFRQWLRERYGRVEQLREAWNDPELTFETVEVPGIDARMGVGEKMFRDPQQEQPVIDYYRCHQELVAEVPLHFTRLVKEHWPRPAIMGLFHGYFFHLTHQASGGHLEMRRVLQSPDVDFLASPYSYEFDARMLGGSGHYRCLMESVRLHGKIWMSENDQPTFFGDHFKRPGPFWPQTLEDTVAEMRRDVAVQVLTTGMGMWYLDFGPQTGGLGGYWSHPELMQEARQLLDLAQRQLEEPFSNPADVLLVYDTTCFYYLHLMYLGIYDQSRHWGRTETLAHEAANRTIADAFKSGAVFDTIHLDDLPLVDLDRYKVIVFAFTPYLTEEHRRFIDEKVERDGRTVVWVYAPGYVDGETLSTKRVGEVIGMDMEKSYVNLAPAMVVREGALGEGVPEIRTAVSITDAWTEPTFKVVDAEAEALGYYHATRDVALARRKFKDHTSWFVGLPLKDPRLIREIFRAGGAHIYNEKNDVLFNGCGLLCLHTETGGPRTIRLRDGRELTFDLPPWSTWLVDLETGEVILK